jgi:S-DNA-T family DNA segregation ATPase FtsK/SpoIIIE
VNIFLGMVLVLVALLLLLALASYRASDPSLNTATDAAMPRNWTGIFGAYLADLLLQTLGLTAFLLPLWMGGVGWTWMHSRPGGSPLIRWIGTVISLVFVPAVFGLLPWHWRWLHAVAVEGVIGRVIAGMLVLYLNIQGAWVVALALAAAGIYFASAISFSTVREIFTDRWVTLMALRDRWRNYREARAEARAEREGLEQMRPQPTPFPQSVPFPQPAADSAADFPGEFVDEELPARGIRRLLEFFRRKRAPQPNVLDEIPAYQREAAKPKEEPVPITSRKPSIWERGDLEFIPVAPAVSVATATAAVVPSATAMAAPLAATAAQPARREALGSHAVEQWLAGGGDAGSHPHQAANSPGAIAIHERADAELRTATVAPKSVSGFKLPPSTLLSTGEAPQLVREDELREEAKVLVEKCAEFDVRGQVVQINPGPMVTTFEFKPEAGVKYSRVTGLADDLCLAMRAESILIERMAGKSTVGIQVPNHERETIHLRDVIESETFAKARTRLTLAMGKDINGRIVTADLASMPHVLIAGSTGSGKSVAINAMIMSLLYRTTPNQVRLILVDPKRVELGMYEGIPHLFTPIITEPKLAANALRNAVREMERRLKLLASRSVRNIDQYNKLFEGSMPSLFDDGQQEEPLPYIIIIIDELADLMMLDRSNVEESITRLAQMARAVGIHLILATQRPSVDVITGLIKANVPTRISFRLATKVDSRTILDTNGAEALLGRGDMLFLPPGTSRLMRLHAPYVSEKETAAIVEFWKNQGAAQYVEDFLEAPKDERTGMEGANDEPGENDPMYDDAVRLVFEFGKASTSLLQRRLRVGYGRAAHLIDLMERDGLVGAADGPRPRELLKAPGWLHEVTANQ